MENITVLKAMRRWLDGKKTIAAGIAGIVVGIALVLQGQTEAGIALLVTSVQVVMLRLGVKKAEI